MLSTMSYKDRQKLHQGYLETWYIGRGSGTLKGLLAVPSPREAKLQGTRQRAFSVVAPALWNALPSGIREINNYLSFRKYLKADLFREVFKL